MHAVSFSLFKLMELQLSRDKTAVPLICLYRSPPSSKQNKPSNRIVVVFSFLFLPFFFFWGGGGGGGEADNFQHLFQDNYNNNKSIYKARNLVHKDNSKRAHARTHACTHAPPPPPPHTHTPLFTYNLDNKQRFEGTVMHAEISCLVVISTFISRIPPMVKSV